VTLVVGVTVWALWPEPEKPLAREYGQSTFCLLTGARGINEPDAVPVWAGMQEASLASLAKVQFLEVDGEQTAENALTYVASLVRSRCDAVFGAGEVPVAALREAAARFPGTRFVVIGAGASSDNVSVVDQSGADAVRAAVRDIVLDLVKQQKGR
jgi:DNA-binding LacI/PurR family transcriptional regulator